MNSCVCWALWVYGCYVYAYIARSVNELCAWTMSKERLLMFVSGCHMFGGVPYGAYSPCGQQAANALF